MHKRKDATYWDLPLNPSPGSDWDRSYFELLKDPFISKKYNRVNRLNDKIIYIKKYLPEIKESTGSVLDIGPGDGCFLEVCRFYGNEIRGIDAKLDDSDMGDAYMRLSKLLVERQKIPVDYVGFDNLLKLGPLPFETNSLSAINSQGCIEMIFRDFMEGQPLKEHRNTSKISWNITPNLQDMFLTFLSESSRILKPNGILLIYGNACGNQNSYHEMIHDISKKANFNIEFSDGSRLHKLRNCK